MGAPEPMKQCRRSAIGSELVSEKAIGDELKCRKFIVRGASCASVADFLVYTFTYLCVGSFTSVTGAGLPWRPPKFEASCVLVNTRTVANFPFNWNCYSRIHVLP